MASQPVHLVVVPFPAYGHLIPALMLADKLVYSGYEVTYVCPEYRIQQVKKQAEARGCTEGIRFHTLKRSCGPDVSSTGHDSFETLFWSIQHYADDAAEFREFMNQLAAPTGKFCLISDNLLASWAQDVADDLNIPRIIIYPSPALALAVVFHLRNLHREGKYPIKTGENQQGIHIPGIHNPLFSPLKPEEISTPALDTSTKYMQEFYIENALRVHDAAGILCNTFMEIEKETCIALKECTELNPNKVPFLPIGPILPQSYFEAASKKWSLDQSHVSHHEEDYLKWLDKQPAGSVVYISFGSFAKPSLEQVKELAYGIETSGKGFLWVLPDGINGLPPGFIERTCERGMLVEKFASQLNVLSHKAVGGFLTHAGWNSTIESITQGVPMLTMPFFGEQSGNARIIADYLRIGIKLVRDGNELINRDVVENGIREIIDNEGFRKKAQELSVAAQAAAKESTKKMAAFIEEVIMNYNKI